MGIACGEVLRVLLYRNSYAIKDLFSYNFLEVIL
jgi:hypothetical protein